MTVQESLKRTRLAAGMTQKQVATQLGITQQSYRVYEDKSSPSADTIIKLSKLYGVSADYLLGLTDDPNPVPVEPAPANDKVMAAAVALVNALREQIREEAAN